jgi:hypothetical protein
MGPVGSGDTPGVKSDKYGNIWYVATSVYFDNNIINQPYFMVSTNKGRHYQLVYTIPLPTDFSIGTFYTDYPQYCFGGDGLGNYGLWFQTTSYGDGWPTVGFLPIFGPKSWGSLTSTPPIQYTMLTGLTNSIGEMDLTASSDGRVWFQGIVAPSVENTYNGVPPPFNYIQPGLTLYKSPGPIDENYAGAWDYINWNSVQFNTTSPTPEAVISQSDLGYFNGPQSIIYDEKRQAIYTLQAVRVPDYSQNMQIFFAISRDNMQTWSQPIDISTTDFANRGFPSMALDIVTGDLIFGWYDGRNDSTYKSIEYFGAIISAEELNELVNNIPLSNPIYTIPSSTASSTALSKKITVDIQNRTKNINTSKSRLMKKFGPIINELLEKK